MCVWVCVDRGHRLPVLAEGGRPGRGTDLNGQSGGSEEVQGGAAGDEGPLRARPAHELDRLRDALLSDAARDKAAVRGG